MSKSSSSSNSGGCLTFGLFLALVAAAIVFLNTNGDTNAALFAFAKVTVVCIGGPILITFAIILVVLAILAVVGIGGIFAGFMGAVITGLGSGAESVKNSVSRAQEKIKGKPKNDTYHDEI